jgi:hypothetical protein
MLIFLIFSEAFHDLDHSLLFGIGKNGHLGSLEAKEIGRMLVKAVSNFVHHGMPNTTEVPWVPSTRANAHRHLLIDGEKPRMRQMEDILERLKFWHRLTEEHTQYNLITGQFGKKTRAT